MIRSSRRIFLGHIAALVLSIGGCGAIALMGPLMLSACGGGGEGGNSTTADMPQPSTEVSLNASVPAAVSARIPTLLSPSGSWALGAGLPISTLGPSGQSLVLALDASGGVLLAATTSDSATVLSADTTGVALVRLALGPVASGTTGVQADGAIRANPDFAALV